MSTTEKLLDETNELLTCVGIAAKRISSLTELSRVASSMFVAVYETLFNVHLEDINRNPHTREEYALNSQKVINELSMQIDINLKHISGHDIANGDLRSISNLLKIFAQIYRTTSSAGSTVGQGGSASLSSRESDMHSEGIGMQANMRDVSLVDTRSTSQAPDTLFTDDHETEHNQSEPRDDDRSLGRGFTDQDQLTISSIDKSEELQRLLEMKNKRLAQDAKLEAARQRRDQQMRLKTHERLHVNRAKDRISLEQQQQRWLEDLAAEQDAHRIRDKSADHALLRKVYTGLVKRMHEWDLEEARLKREREALQRDDLADRVHALESILAERKETYQARDQARREDERRSLLAHRQMMRDLRRSLDDRFSQFQLDYMRKRGVRHDRDVLKRQESYKDLLSMMSVGPWEHSLRSSFPADRPRSTPHFSGVAAAPALNKSFSTSRRVSMR